jgi:2-polyprenyl-6-methoxyphenol hydroxylase-like FAD-dependent oxidoreductase
MTQPARYAELARYDVAIVGARAAGAATALLLARLGHDVVFVDRADRATDTVSTHQIARTGVVALHRWGLLAGVLASGAPPLRQVTWHAEGGSVTRTLRSSSNVDCLVAPRRYVLDTLLGDAAVRAGALRRTGIAIGDVRRDPAGRVVGVSGHDRAGDRVEIAARFVVGADGLSSRIARSVGAGLIEDRGTGGATQYAYFAGLPWPGIEFHTADRGFAGVFPTHDGEACVWICTPELDARAARRAAGTTAAAFERQLRRAAPDLARRLESARRTSPISGRLRSPNQLRHAHGPGWALVGDAGFHRDPVSAHGISDAFRDAELLAVALDDLLTGRADEPVALARYQARRDAALREVFDLTCALVAYPPAPEFTDLMRRLGRAIDTGAAGLAAQPVPGLVPA